MYRIRHILLITQNNQLHRRTYFLLKLWAKKWHMLDKFGLCLGMFRIDYHILSNPMWLCFCKNNAKAKKDKGYGKNKRWVVTCFKVSAETSAKRVIVISCYCRTNARSACTAAITVNAVVWASQTSAWRYIESWWTSSAFIHSCAKLAIWLTFNATISCSV